MEPEKHYLLEDEAPHDSVMIHDPSFDSSRFQTLPTGHNLLRGIKTVWWPIFLAMLVGYVAGIITLMGAGASSSYRFNLKPSYSPAQSAVQMELQQLQFPAHGEYSRFSGDPRKETEEAWHELTAPLMIQASREEMERGGEKPDASVRLADGGYLASTGVYHELHCLKRMRWYLYRDTYYQNLTEEQDSYLKGHIDHCIETLRILAMCQADVSLYSYEWRTHDNYTRQERKSNSKKVCVKWDKLASWMGERSVTWNPRLVAPEP